MEINIKDKTMKWMLNGVEFYEMIENIDLRTPYRLAACICKLDHYDKSVVQLQEFVVNA